MRLNGALPLLLALSTPGILSAAEPEKGAVEVEIKNADLYLAPEIILEVHSLRGRLNRTRPDRPVTFDDSGSFTVEIDSGEVAMTTGSLAALMNSYVFASPGASIKNISVSMAGSELIQKGIVHKGVDVPFEVRASVSPTPDGEIRVHADKIKAGHLPVKGLLHFLGEDLSKLIKENPQRGLRAEGDDLILSPRAMTPPPHMEGHVSRITVRDGRLVQTFSSDRRSAPLHPPLGSRAYLYFRGNVLQFGKLTMSDADMELVGDRDGPFHFFMAKYKEQLVAGYSKNTRANGLVVHMKDYTRLSQNTMRAAR